MTEKMKQILEKVHKYNMEHLEEIKAFGTDLIEIPAIVLLVVSDNSASGVPLVGRSEEEKRVYNNAGRVVLKELIEKIALL